MFDPSTAVVALRLKDATSWWDGVNESPVWQDRIFHLLAALYGIVAVVALVQLVRIQLRVPDYGWTTQKVFHFLNFLVNGVRCLVFVFRRDVQKLNPEIIQHIVLDMPSLAFFTTYALLVLFWAEIYYQARAVSTDGLRPTFYTINGVVYAIQIILWLILWWKPIPVLIILSKMFFAGVSLFAALGFLLYGGRLFLMLQRFPVESKGRRKKLQEVGYVTTICFSCFLIRCIMARAVSTDGLRPTFYTINGVVYAIQVNDWLQHNNGSEEITVQPVTKELDQVLCYHPSSYFWHSVMLWRKN